MAKDVKWIVFSLRQRYSNDRDRGILKSDIVSKFGISENDVYYVPVQDNFALCHYIFVKEHDENDMKNIEEYRHDMFDAYVNHARITGDELVKMTDSISMQKLSGEFKQGDIVKIKNGIYSRLNGIVLKVFPNGKIKVGMKFCFGVVVENYRADDIVVTGNIFNYIKVLN